MRAKQTEEHEATAAVAKNASPRRRYRMPKLVRFGDIRDLTLGSSPGVGESGNPVVFRQEI